MLKKATSALKAYLPLLLLLLIVLILRVPNFYEPYWYGDEAIYLAVGTGLRNGLKLYTQIIDHKTPLIYYLAMTPTQFQFRLLNLGWMLATASFFYFFAMKILKKSWAVFVASFTFVLLTTLPMLEGNIPNGELFVMGFVMVGAYLLSKTNHFTDFLQEKKLVKLSSIGLKDSMSLFVAGFFVGLGILTKVPALLDFGALLILSWFILTNNIDTRNPTRSLKNILPKLLVKTILFSIGTITPIILSIIYYVSLGSGQDYLDYGLLYNIRYSGSWQPDFPNIFVAKIFTLPGKTTLLAIFILGLTFLRNKITPRFQFLASWFVLSFFAALLSNRPYPHYLMQLVPSFALLTGLFLEKFCNIKNKTKSKPVEWLIFAILIISFFITKNILDFSKYPTLSYYQRFFQLKSGEISKKEYDESFNWLVKENYEVAELIEKLKIEKMFIWGTNPMLYAQTQTIPTSRFTVSFHIKDFNDYDRTFAQIEKEKPRLIIVMKNETTPFPQLEEYLQKYYLPNSQYQSMTLYLKNANN